MATSLRHIRPRASVARLHKCACRDCTVETTATMCQRCINSMCAAAGNADCHAPNAYALQSKKPSRDY